MYLISKIKNLTENLFKNKDKILKISRWTGILCLIAVTIFASYKAFILRKDLSACKRAEKRLENTIQEFSIKNKSLWKDNQSLRAQINEVYTASGETEMDRKKIVGYLKRLTARNEELTQRIIRINEELAAFETVQEEKERLEKEREFILKQLREFEGESAAAQEEKGRLRDQLRLYRQRLVEIAQAKKEMEEVLDELIEEIKGRSKMVEGEKKPVKDIREDRDEFFSQKGDVLVELGKRILYLKNQIYELTNEVEKLSYEREKAVVGGKDFVEREESFEKAIEGLKIKLEISQMNEEEFKKELSALRVRTRQERVDMHYNLGVVYQSNGMFEDAIREYNKVLTIKPDDSDTHYNMAVVYDEYLFESKKAMAHYKKYLEFRPNAKDADKVLGWLFQLEKRSKF